MPRRPQTWSDYLTLITIVGALLSAGMWLGRMQSQVDDLSRHQKYEHGDYTVPEGAK